MKKRVIILATFVATISFPTILFAKEDTLNVEDIELDDLQKLYVTIDSKFTYAEMLDAIIESGLPYSEKKYNGSRGIQISFTEDGTAQSYNKSGEDYIYISYDYPRNENSSNDVLEKYFFDKCTYVQDSGFTLNFSADEFYFKDLGTTVIDPDISSQLEQLKYYLNR